MGTPFIDLLALPCAGASATMYLRWRRSMPPWIRVVPVELPGRGIRMGEPFVEDFDRLVAQISDEHAASMRGRYALFGHSMGALLAYCVAQRQHALAGPLPRAVFVSASPAPSRRDPGRFVGKDDDAALIADLRKQGGTPEEVFASSELLRLTLNTLAADYRVCASFRYRAGEPIFAPIHVFAGREDDIAAERIEAWRREAGDVCTLDWFDGGHFFIRQQEQQVIAAVVRELTHRFSGADHVATASA
ncbi:MULTISPECIES: thioesterase II family protein [Methylosinus]|uniref:Thioesterase n=1 Tax=Methylosinus trichosporium (strain ATCC 35070 / NCIMB 11131 / UNIQEM 75 / OB3b) TaxID=595536 RepID=A0A2D2D7C0_METT3|nr:MULTISPECIES: alpha/beta fold hydrolase [Methylosinus]ATQ70921.1 thioesterase [Methylosinus trichosporium OB3b]OBS50433.1 thioesterase [Methylosinus sp. 3S-1]